MLSRAKVFGWTRVLKNVVFNSYLKLHINNQRKFQKESKKSENHHNN